MADQQLKLKIKSEVDKSPLQQLQAEMKRIGVEQQHLYEWGQKDSKVFQENAQKINQLKTSIKELQGVSKGFSGKAPLSGFQILEGLENITVALAGFKASISGLAGLVSSSARSFADFKEVSDNFAGTATDIDLFQQATGRVVGKGDLLKLSNQATDLGIALKDQPVLFLASKEASEKYGISVSDAFNKVISATEGQVRGVKALGIQKAQYNEVLEGLVKATGGEIEAMQDVNGEQEITIKNLDFATQKRLRLNAFLQIYGKTLKDVTDRQQTEADKLHQLDLLLPAVKKQFGELVAKGLVPLTDALKNNEGKFSDLTVGIAGVGFALQDVLPVIATARLAFAGLLPAGIVATVGTLATGIGAVAGAIYLMVKNIKYGIELFQSGGGFIELLTKIMTTGVFNQPATSNPNTYDSINKIIDQLDPDIIETPTATVPFPKAPKTGSKGTSTQTKEETLTYLADLNKKLTDLQSTMARQTADENLIGGFIGQEKDLKLLIQLVENFKQLSKITGTFANLPDTGREPIAQIGIDPLLKFRIALQEDEARKKEETERIQRIQNAFESGLSFSQLIASTLYGGVDNSMTRLLNGLDAGLNILQSFFNLFNLITGGAGGGLFGFIGGIFGGGSGGANMAGGAFLPSAQGGAGAMRTIEVPYIIGTEIQGTTLKQVLRRVDNVENSFLS